jgi:hypothetical protein
MMATPTTPQKINVQETQQLWTPNRNQRFQHGDQKDRSQNDGPFRGGDFVLDGNGKATTLSFCFEHEEDIFGLTVGHLASGVGDSIFIFSESDPIPDPTRAGEPHSMSYYMFKVGVVVSVSPETDSLVFSIGDHINVECLKLAPGAGIGVKDLVLPVPNNQSTPPPLATDLVGFGAQRRGAHGKVVSSSETEDGMYSRIGTIGIASADGELTDGGDCGTLFLNLDC